jgi:hypothetical protein
METTTTPATAWDGAAQGAQPALGAASAAVQANEAGTPQDGVQSQQEGQQVSLADLVRQYPHLKDQIEKEFVSPHLKRMEQGRQKLEREIEDRVLARAEQSRLQAQAAQLAQQAQSPDESVRNRALVELGKLQLASQQTAAGQQQLEAERQRVRAEMASNFARDVLKLDPASIPQDVLQDDEKFAEFAWANSPRTKQLESSLKAQLTQMSQDASAVASAQTAADFGVKLQTTPSPNAMEGGAPTGARPLTQAEFDSNRRDPAWLKRNLPRLRAAMDSGAVTR